MIHRPDPGSFEISICVATFMRPDGLRELLESLVNQRNVEGRFGIVVVDNDPDGTAQPIVAESQTDHYPPIIYAVEPSPGIPAVRNRSIALAREAGAATVAFIDDDEFAAPYWLATLQSRLKYTPADAVSGPVEPVLPSDAPIWSKQTRAFHRSTFPDGARLAYASTANAMLRLDALAGSREPFDDAFRFTGGADTLLFRTLHEQGKRIVWEPNALVYERVPTERLSMRWLIARGYRHGVTLARCDRIILQRRRTLRLTWRAFRGIAQIGVGTLQVAISLVRTDPHWRNGLIRIARGIGVIAGFLGISYEEYRRLHEVGSRPQQRPSRNSPSGAR